jgi:hypothetical protein
MTLSPFAGKPAPAELLVDIPRLVTAYYTGQPDASISTQRVAFGTSGHRGSSFDLSFNEWHVLAISQAICLYREAQASMARCLSASTPTRCRPGRCQRPGSAGRQWRDGDDGRRR